MRFRKKFPGESPLTSLGRSGTAVLLLALSLTPMVSGAVAGPAHAATGTGGRVAASESAALKQARRSGTRVEVGALRGESREVYARPDGSFEAVQHLRPVRTRQGGKWVDIDTTLRRRRDGSVGPVAATVGLTFSGGGSAPMATMVQAGRKLSFSWPGALPTPVLSGSTATYEDVIDGVDLQLHADAEGFSDVLVVKTREAARDPKLARLRFATSASGVSLKRDSAGGLRAVDDGGGGAVFEAPQPAMWDSATGTGNATGAAKPAARADAMGGSDASHRAPIGVRVSKGAVTLTPDRAMLSDSSTRFPVYIDPVYKTVKDSAWLMVSSGGWKDYDFSGDEGMGYCPYDYSYDCGSHFVKRLFYRMPTSGFGGKTIISAEFQIKETFAPSCTTRTVQLWKTKAFGTSSTWNSTSDNWLEHLDSKDVAKGYSGSCPAGDVIFDATAGMKEAAAGGWSTLTLGLRAATEDSQLAWKRFADDAYLRVHYNTPPPQPSMKNLWSSPGGGCAGPSAPARLNEAPTAHATLTDPDGDKISAEFQASWDDGSGWGPKWTSAKIGPYSSGTDFKADLPSTIPENTLMEWHVRAYDGMDYSPWSYAGNATGCYFLYDHTAPAPPVITSPAYADGGYPESNPNDENDPWYAGVGRYGTFTFTAADTDVVKYTYGIVGDPSGFQDVATTDGAPQTVQIMPTSEGVNVLQVSAVDGAGNTSTGTYAFRVSAGSTAKATYAMDEPIGSAQITDTAGDDPATVHGGATLGVDGVTGTAMQFNGIDAYAATSGPLLDTTKSFAVSAWVNLASKSGVPVVVSQEGTTGSSFALYYQSSSDRWEFNMQTPDDQPWTAVVVQSKAPPTLGEWTHLAGVYDATAKTISLYVNGVLQQTLAQPNTWGSSGPLDIGRYRSGGGYGSQYYFSGAVDDLHVFDRVVTGDEVTKLFSQRPVVAARWKLNDAEATVRAPKAYWKLDEASGAARAEDTQGGFPAGLHGGATFGAAGKVGTAMHLPGSTGYAATDGPVVDTTKSFSVSGWARLTAKTTTPVVASQEGTVGSAFALYYSKNYDRWIFNMQTPDSNTPTYVRAQSTAPPSLDTWTHLVGVYDAVGKQIRLYVNGVLQQTTDQPNVWDGAGPLDLGRFKSKGAYTAYFTGDLDDVRVFDQAITDSEAALLAGASSAAATTADDSIFGHHATLFGNAYVDQGAGWVGDPPGALVLDGDGDYAATSGPVIDTGRSFTVAGWVQTAGRPSRNAAIFSQEGDVNSGFTLRYAPDPNDPANAGAYQIDMPDADATGATHQTANDSSFQSAGDWDHVAIVYDAFADQMRLYVNGVLQQTDSNVSYRNHTVGFDATKAFQLGRTKTDGTYGEYWPGLIDDVWAFNGVATDDQIAELAYGDELPTSTF